MVSTRGWAYGDCLGAGGGGLGEAKRRDKPKERSCEALWCMLGYLVGLGDRHGENILLDTESGRPAVLKAT